MYIDRQKGQTQHAQFTLMSKEKQVAKERVSGSHENRRCKGARLIDRRFNRWGRGNLSWPCALVSPCLIAATLFLSEIFAIL